MFDDFDREAWLFILRALEWDEESAKYYEDDEYDYVENTKIRAKIKAMIGENDD